MLVSVWKDDFIFEVFMEKKSIFKENFDLVLLIIHAINLFVYFLISLGLFDANQLVSYYLILSIVIIIPSVFILKWNSMKKGEENKLIYEHIPFISIASLELVLGVKFCLQLIKEAHWMAITVIMTFMLLCLVLSFLYNDKCKGSVKKKGICYLMTYVSFLVFLFANLILVLDWWYL